VNAPFSFAEMRSGFRINLRALFHELHRLLFHTLLQCRLLVHALCRSVVAHVLVIFMEQKCGPHMEQKCATLALSRGKVSSWNSRALSGSGRG